MADKQLNVWIPEDLRAYVAHRAEQEHCGMNRIISDLIEQDMARRNGDIVERHTLVVLQELVAAELRQTHAQLRRDLRADREQEAEAGRDWFRRQMDRLAGLLVMAVRNGSITRRLLYVHLSKTYGQAFAKLAYTTAKEKAREELFPKKTAHPHELPEDDEDELASSGQ